MLKMQKVEGYKHIPSKDSMGSTDPQELLIHQMQRMSESLNDMGDLVKDLTATVKRQENEINVLKERIIELRSNENPSYLDDNTLLSSSDLSYSETSHPDEILLQTPNEQTCKNKSNLDSTSENKDFHYKGGEYPNNTHIMDEMGASSLVEKYPGQVWPKVLNMDRVSKNKVNLDETYKSWLICPQQLTFDRLIGRGSSSLVYKGRYKDDIVAIKVLNFNPIDSRSLEKQHKELAEEVNVMKSVKSKYVVNLHGIVLEPAICIVMEYCENGSLYDILRKKQRLGWTAVLRTFKEIVCGVAILHRLRPPIVHRDLKSLNILLTKDMRVKVADFGLSRLIESKEHYSTLYKLRGTHTYCAPEVYLGEQYTDKSDIYSLGIILWELVYRCTKKEYQRPFSEYPWINYSFQVIIQTAKNGLRPTIPPCPEKIRSLICTLWDYNPSKRPDACTLLSTVKQLEREYHENRREWQEMCLRAKEYKDIQAPDLLSQRESDIITKKNFSRVQKPQLFKWVLLRKDKRKVKKSIKFEDLLADQKLYQSFESFLKKELCDEYLRFWKQLKLFIEVPQESMVVRATNIYTTYLVSDVVAIDPKQLKIISKKMRENNIDKNIFEEVRYEVESILKTKFSYFIVS